ncbi:hypothetical protein F8388_021618 [Cannabis sativa]|uniref:Uncharacterized protein n=1 Tax=Cannabis sativa TaxID=3483 RepID=A0A7J6G651_CANSA|nr:hypothetical protein F8388_021618 [Cannabis sativa]
MVLPDGPSSSLLSSTEVKLIQRCSYLLLRLVTEQVVTATVAATAGGGPFSSSSSPPPSASSSPPPSASSSPSLVEEAGVESSERGTGPNGNAGKRPACNMPSNGIAEVGTVMGADSWPELESVRASAKSSSDSLKALSDGLSSVSISQSSGTTVAVAPTAAPTQKHAHPTPTPSHAATARQRNNEVQFAGEIQPKGCNCRLEVPAGDPKMLDRQVVKFEFATIKVTGYPDRALDMDVDIDHYTILGLPTGQDGAKLTEKKISKVYTCN